MALPAERSDAAWLVPSALAQRHARLLPPPPGPALIRVGVVGVSGYAGGELCRWLLDHPEFELVSAVSRGHVGRPLAEVLPALEGCTDLTCEGFSDRLNRLDAVFLATPHGAAVELAADLGRTR